MTNEEIKKGIDGLKFTMDMLLFDPMTGENKRPDCLNDMDKITYDACVVGIEAFEKQIPRKPIWAIPVRKRSGYTWCCPVCGYTAIRSYNYCQHDGTEFDWSGIK